MGISKLNNTLNTENSFAMESASLEKVLKLPILSKHTNKMSNLSLTLK